MMHLIGVQNVEYWRRRSCKGKGSECECLSASSSMKDGPLCQMKKEEGITDITVAPSKSSIYNLGQDTVRKSDISAVAEDKTSKLISDSISERQEIIPETQMLYASDKAQYAKPLPWVKQLYNTYRDWLTNESQAQSDVRKTVPDNSNAHDRTDSKILKNVEQPKERDEGYSSLKQRCHQCIIFDGLETTVREPELRNSYEDLHSINESGDISIRKQTNSPISEIPLVNQTGASALHDFSKQDTVRKNDISAVAKVKTSKLISDRISERQEIIPETQILYAFDKAQYVKTLPWGKQLYNTYRDWYLPIAWQVSEAIFAKHPEPSDSLAAVRDGKGQPPHSRLFKTRELVSERPSGLPAEEDSSCTPTRERISENRLVCHQNLADVCLSVSKATLPLHSYNEPTDQTSPVSQVGYSKDDESEHTVYEVPKAGSESEGVLSPSNHYSGQRNDTGDSDSLPEKERCSIAEDGENVPATECLSCSDTSQKEDSVDGVRGRREPSHSVSRINSHDEDCVEAMATTSDCEVPEEEMVSRFPTSRSDIFLAADHLSLSEQDSQAVSTLIQDEEVPISSIPSPTISHDDSRVPQSGGCFSSGKDSTRTHVTRQDEPEFVHSQLSQLVIEFEIFQNKVGNFLVETIKIGVEPSFGKSLFLLQYLLHARSTCAALFLDSTQMVERIRKHLAFVKRIDKDFDGVSCVLELGYKLKQLADHILRIRIIIEDYLVAATKYSNVDDETCLGLATYLLILKLKVLLCSSPEYMSNKNIYEGKESEISEHLNSSDQLKTEHLMSPDQLQLQSKTAEVCKLVARIMKFHTLYIVCKRFQECARIFAEMLKQNKFRDKTKIREFVGQMAGAFDVSIAEDTEMHSQNKNMLNALEGNNLASVIFQLLFMEDMKCFAFDAVHEMLISFVNIPVLNCGIKMFLKMASLRTETVVRQHFEQIQDKIQQVYDVGIAQESEIRSHNKTLTYLIGMSEKVRSSSKVSGRKFKGFADTFLKSMKV